MVTLTLSEKKIYVMFLIFVVEELKVSPVVSEVDLYEK